MASDAAQLRAAFTKFDTNLSGAISLEDFVDVMTRTGRDCRPTSREQAVALFQRFDTNGSGVVNLHQFVRAWSSRSCCSPSAGPRVSRSPSLGELENMYKAPETIWEELDVRDGLVLPPVRLLKSSWLIARAEKVKAASSVAERRALALPRRQELEARHPEAFYTCEEVKALKRGSDLAGKPLSVLSVSHCWESAEHPDPQGTTLVKLCDAMRHAMTTAVTNGDYTWEKLPGELAVFFDYGSLYQKSPSGEPRTADEHAAFKAALARMQVWYAHQLTTCFFMTTAVDAASMPYLERGWPTFEYHVSMLAKAWTSSGWPQLFDVGRGVDKLFTRNPPLSTASLRELLETKAFASGADRDLVAFLYQKTAVTTIQGAALLKFNSSGWGPEQLMQFIDQWLPHCEKLEAISFASNPIGPDGAKMLCDSLRLGHCPLATFLNFFNNQIGDEGLAHVAAFLKEREQDKARILPRLNKVRVGKNGTSRDAIEAFKVLCKRYGLKCEA